MNKKNYGFIYISFPKHIFMCISGKNYRVLWVDARNYDKQ
jgi:hypothetical protein